MIFTFAFQPFMIKEAKAQMIVEDLGNLVENVINVINTTASSIYEYAMKYKELVLDGLAYVVAKQVLHSLTASVVDWINSGFEGSPAFLTNPSGFFLDTADQITGYYLSNAGPLSQLCYPFNIDIRLSLALSQTTKARKRYTCTLGKIIENFKNLPENSTINGQSMNQFISGDFSQGRWDAFLALTTQPQNNPYGTYLMAESDLISKVNSNNLKINADLQLGSGFMSWPKCTDLATIDPNNDAEVEQAETIVGGDTSVQTKMNSDGTLTYRSCIVQTPGSVIAGSLQKSLDAPIDELNLADELNEIVSALFSQLVKKVLVGGLYNSSNRNSGSGGQSITEQLANSLPNEVQYEDIRQKLLPDVEKGIANATQYKISVETSYNYINNARLNLLDAKSCFQGMQSGAAMDATLVSQYLSQIEAKLAETNTKYATYKSQLDNASSTLSRLQNIKATIESATNDSNESISKLEVASREYGNLASSGSIASANDIKNANEKIKEAKKYAEGVESFLAPLRNICSFSLSENTQ